MPKFKVGDHVQRVGPLVPEYTRLGVVAKVIPNAYGFDWFTQYDVDFGNNVT